MDSPDGSPLDSPVEIVKVVRVDLTPKNNRITCFFKPLAALTEQLGGGEQHGGGEWLRAA